MPQPTGHADNRFHRADNGPHHFAPVRATSTHTAEIAVNRSGGNSPGIAPALLARLCAEEQTARALLRATARAHDTEHQERFDESEGVWRTIRGNPVFIRHGQSVGDAIREWFWKRDKAKRESVESGQHPRLEPTGRAERPGLSRAERAKLSYNPATAEKMRVAFKMELRVARAIGGVNLGDNEPADVVRGNHAIEVKTIVAGKNPKIAMHPDSLRRKLAYGRREGKTWHTVAIDARSKPPKIYYKRGVGSFRLSSMEQISLRELRKRLQ